MVESKQRRGRIVIILFGIVALTFIVMSISSNLGIWRQNDAVDAGTPTPQ